MIKNSISNKIVLIAVLPVIVLSILLTSYYTITQINFISEQLNQKGRFIVNQLEPTAEYIVFSGDTEFFQPLVKSLLDDKSILRIQIRDKNNRIIYDSGLQNHHHQGKEDLLERFIDGESKKVFTRPIKPASLIIEDFENMDDNTPGDEQSDIIGKIIVTLTTHYANHEKLTHIENSILLTLFILAITVFLIIWRSRTITEPIKSLTDSVRHITEGDLDTKIDVNADNELGVLQSCINNMTQELRHFQSDMESQLNEYTHELQETLEELEVRNAELDITRSKAIYANKAKSEFLANMSHEIRTPLSGIIGFAELLQRTQLTAQQKDYSTTIYKSAKHLLEIINDILDLSKIESGKTEISTSKFRLVDIVEDIIILLNRTALEKNIELFYRIDSDVPETIQADPFRLHQILMNLIANAVKFTSKGYVYLQITRGNLEKAETSIKFAVSDTGIGLSAEDKKKLFKAFTQADTTITRRFGGTGLGLVISRKLTLLMKGEMGFDSTKGEGSTFWFTIPVKVINEDAPDEQAEMEAETASKTRQIAFFCDHFIARQAFSTHFSNWGYHVTAYQLDDLKSIDSIEKQHDLAVVFLGIKSIHDQDINATLNQLEFSIPSFLIASTRSLTTLRKLQQHTFYNAVFTSDKIDIIRQKLSHTLNRSLAEIESDETDNQHTTLQDWSDLDIMVVDDNEVNLRLVEIFLQNHKARVTCAHSGTQAIDYARTSAFDLVFMDLHMPDIDGYETARTIREITPGKQPVIIALTANVMPQEKEKVAQAGMNGLLLKPISDAILQKIVNQWIYKKTGQTTDFIEDDEDRDAPDNKNHVFSLELAREFTGNNEELAYELFGMLRAELDHYEQAIREAVKNNDLAALREQVHKLHGASRCCGTTELKEISSKIENLIDQKTEFDRKLETEKLLAAIKRVRDYPLDDSSRNASA